MREGWGLLKIPRGDIDDDDVYERRETRDDDDDVYYYICQRLKLEGDTENMGVCTKERKGDTAEVLMATPCTKEEKRWGLLKITAKKK